MPHPVHVKDQLIQFSLIQVALDINEYIESWRDDAYRSPSKKRVVNATPFLYFDALCNARKSTGQDVVVQNVSALEACQGHEDAKSFPKKSP
jgi:hypothetical protein